MLYNNYKYIIYLKKLNYINLNLNYIIYKICNIYNKLHIT